MEISVITLFPELFSSVFSASIIARAIRDNKINLSFVQLRDFATDHYKSVDDHPYGGGDGMILRVDIVDKALTYAKSKHRDLKATSILLDPQGTTYTQTIAEHLSTKEHLIIVCGHYEGVDERIRNLVDMEMSVGDYVLTGGEIPAMIVIDSITRLIPTVLKKSTATQNESFSNNLLEYPQYTRPPSYHSMDVPNILLSGDHAQIELWRSQQAKIKTQHRRPDLLLKTD